LLASTVGYSVYLSQVNPRPFARLLKKLERLRGDGIPIQGVSFDYQLGCIVVSWGVDAIALSDTTGMAHPASVKRLLEIVLPESRQIPIVLHFHDTRGLGLANVLTALQCGITRFDAALAGMGGCPFVPGAAGNIATEDTLYLMRCLGIVTGIDIAGVVACSLRLEKFLNKQFPGKIHHLSPAPKF